uniref:DUF3795 domain-containing protein n=1 Tax=Heterorhabditis bacteriophora TaxID=37862 RepID=A0A1I7X680_HETBA
MREGNLPKESKCVVCRKSCCSTECLAGMRCEWCGQTGQILALSFHHPLHPNITAAE